MDADRRKHIEIKTLAMDALRQQATDAIAVSDYERARKALNQARDLEDVIRTLKKYQSDEEHRRALVLELENGYH